MQTTSFVLGMLTIISLIFFAAVVLGMVKIYSLIRSFKGLENKIEDDKRNYYQDQERLHRRIDEDANHIHDRIMRESESSYERLEQQRRDILSYVDSRFDKLQTKSKEAKS